MTTMVDLGSAAAQMSSLLERVTDDQLTQPTPCPGYTLGDLIDHVSGLSQAFTAAATKAVGSGTSQGPSGDASGLGDNWRTRIPKQLAALAYAWRDPNAWGGDDPSRGHRPACSHRWQDRTQRAGYPRLGRRPRQPTAVQLRPPRP